MPKNKYVLKIETMKKLFVLGLGLMFCGCSSSMPKEVLEVSEKEFVCGIDKVKDADGNEYKTAYFDIDGGHDVTKEGQCWMAENLNVGKTILNPGDEPSDDGVIEKWCLNQFIGHTPGLFHNTKDSDITYCNGLDIQEGSTLRVDEHRYGGLYSWQEITKNRYVCPIGWEIPTEKDWGVIQKLIKLNMDEVSIWIKENESSIRNFTIGEKINFPIHIGGLRMVNGEFETNSVHSPTYFWAREDLRTSPLPKMIYFGFSETDAWLGTSVRTHHLVHEKSEYFNAGLSVRCIKRGRN